MSGEPALMLPPSRWSPPYHQHEFVLQERPPLDHTEDALTQLARTIDRFSVIVDDLRLPAWQGPAADGYRNYLSSLSYAIGSMSLLLDSSAGSVGLATDNIEGYQRPIAVEAAEMCNDGQVSYWQIKQNQVAIEAAGLPTTDISFAACEQAVAAGLARGAICQQGVQEALQGLADALLSCEEQFSYLGLPKPVFGSDPVLADIFTPVVISGVSTGQTIAAETVLARFTGSEYVVIGDLRTSLEALTPAEREWVLDHLPSWILTAMMLDNGVADLQGDYEWFAKNLPLDQLDFIAGADPHGYYRPTANFEEGPQNLFWAPVTGGANPSSDPSILTQGAIGDCHLLASLAAIATSPTGRKFLDEHIQKNANGTYTVTLYTALGIPFEVTVLPEVVASEEYDGTDNVAYAKPAQEELTAYQIYEKAVAQASAAGLVDLNGRPGGFPDLNFGTSVVDLPILTGVEAVQYPSAEVTGAAIAAALAGGRPVTVATFIEGQSKPNDFFSGGRAPVNRHAYYVTSIDLVGPPPTVTLGNPWGNPGADGGGTTDLTLTIEELQQGTASVTFGGAP